MAPDLQEIVEQAADLLRAPATLEDRDFHLVAYAAHGDTIDPVRTASILHRRATEAVRARFERHGIARATGPVRIPADTSLGQLGRLCLPARWNNVTYGYLWLLDDEERITGDQAAEAMPSASAPPPHGPPGPGARRPRLQGGGPALRPRRRPHPGGRRPHRREGGRPAPHGGRPANPEPRAPQPVAAPPLGPDHGLAARPRPAHPGLDQHRDHPQQSPPPPGGTPRPRPGGPVLPCPTLDDVHEGWLRARVAARTAAPGETRDWTSLGVLRLLRTAGDEALTQTTQTEGTQRLLHNQDLTKTARTYLDLAGNVQQTAKALNIHRQTLYHRLRRIEALTNLTLTNGQDRLTLHLALTLSPTSTDRKAPTP